MNVLTYVELFFAILILSLTIWGIACLFTEGMLFESIGQRIEESNWKPILKPVILCPPCMASVYGTLFAFSIHLHWTQWIVLVFASCGLNYIIANK